MFTVTDPNFDNPTRSDRGRLVDPEAGEFERIYSVFLHLTQLVHVPVPVVPALIMWLIKKDDSPYIDDHGREAVNFQISLLIYYAISALLIPVCGIGALTACAVWILGLIGMIMAAVAAHRGEYFRYPATIRFLH